MNIFAFAAAGTYIPPERAKRICFEHSVVYHGTSTRPAGRSFDSLRSGVKGPLLISRSGRFVPQVFSPWPSAVVVSEAVKNRLASFGNLAFVEVQFKHLVDLPLKKGDQSLVKEVKEGFQRSVDDRGEPVESHSQILIDWRPNIPEFHRAIGRYYELLCVLLHEVEDEFPDAGKRPLHVVLDPRPRSILDETVTVSPEMFRQYPLIGDGIMHLCSEAFYEAIAPYVDWDFYLGHWYRVDDPVPGVVLMRRSYHPKCRILATPEIIGGAPILGIMFNVERNGEPFDGSEPGLYCGFAFLDRLDEPRSALNFYDFDRVKQIDIHVEEVMEKPVPGFYWRESALVPFTWEEIDLSEDADPVESDSDEGEEGQSKPRDAR